MDLQQAVRMAQAGLPHVQASMQHFHPLLLADDVPACRQLAQMLAPFWPGWSPTTSLAELVAIRAVQCNSLRVLQHQLRLPEGAVEAALAGRLPTGGSEQAVAAGADPLHLRDSGELDRLLAIHTASPAREAAALMVLAAGGEADWTLVFTALIRRMPALLEAALRRLPPWETMPLPDNYVLRVPCGYRRFPYNESPALHLLGLHQEQGRDPWDPINLRMAEAMGVAGARPPVYHNVRVYREARLPRPTPGKQRTNLEQEQEQHAEVEATFHPVLEDDSFGARDRCRYMWLAITQQQWLRDNHDVWPARFRQAARALLLTARRLETQPAAGAAAGSSREVGQEERGAGPRPTLGSLPAGVLQHILGLAAHPVSAWADNDA